MEFECLHCERRYLYEESPSDLFCSQGCSEEWTHRASWEAERRDAELDRTLDSGLLRSRHIGDATQFLEQRCIYGGVLPRGFTQGDAVVLVSPPPLALISTDTAEPLWPPQQEFRVTAVYGIFAGDGDRTLDLHLACPATDARYLVYTRPGGPWRLKYDGSGTSGHFTVYYERLR